MLLLFVFSVFYEDKAEFGRVNAREFRPETKDQSRIVSPGNNKDD